MPVSTSIDRQADTAPEHYGDLRAVIFNGTLKRSPEPSRTDALLAIPRGILTRVGVRVDEVRTVDHEIPPGVWPDMTQYGYPRDDFPAIYRELVAPADIVILAGPIWLGDQSSLTRKIVERLYAYSAELDGKAGGVVTTGDQPVSAQVLYALRLIGLTVPAEVDAGRDSAVMTWELLQSARALKHAAPAG
jgi:multimeric flavodoxin WrbA